MSASEETIMNSIRNGLGNTTQLISIQSSKNFTNSLQEIAEMDDDAENNEAFQEEVKEEEEEEEVKEEEKDIYTSVVKVNATTFILKHISGDAAKDCTVEVYIDDDEVEFEGLPRAMAMQMDNTFSFQDRKDFPDTCLYLLCRAQTDADQGLRP